MPAAFTPVVAGSDVASVAPGSVVESIYTSALERYRAVFGDPGGVNYGSPVALPAVGQPVMSASFWGSGIDAMLFSRQSSGLAAVNLYLDHRQPVEGAAALVTWTAATLRAAAGLPVTKVWQRNTSPGGAPTSISTEITDLRNTLFKRVRRREISTTADTCDNQGNPAVAGQYAFGTSIPTAINSAVGGFVYRCVAAGNWVHDEPHAVDLIDNTQDPPDAVTGDVPPGYPSFGGDATWGAVRAGDCMGLWVYQERQAVIDLLRWTVLPCTLAGSAGAGGPYIRSSGRDQFLNPTGPYSTSAAAESAAASAWAGGAPSAAPGAFPLAFNRLEDAGGGFNWYTEAERTDADFSPLAPVSALAKKWSYFVRGKAVNPGRGGLGTVFTFDAQGDPVTDGTYHAWSSSAGAVTATSPASGRWGNAAAFPANAPAPAANTDTVNGYETADMVLVCKWNVAGGGFTWCSATD